MVQKPFNIPWIIITMFAMTGCVTESDQTVFTDPENVVQKQIELGIGYLRLEDYHRAKENLNKALTIKPESALAHTTFGVIFQREGEIELAEEHFRKAIRYAPEFSQARNNYGAFLFAQERYGESIEQLSIASRDHFYQTRPAVFENLGRAYLRVNEPARAEQAFVKAIELNPAQARALLELAEIRFNQKVYVESWDLYRQHAGLSHRSARSLWLCVQLAERFSSKDEQASCSLALRNIFPATEEYRQFRTRYGKNGMNMEGTTDE